jgi:ribosome biogenesis GTPase
MILDPDESIQDGVRYAKIASNSCQRLKRADDSNENLREDDDALLKEERIRRSHEDRDPTRRKTVRKREKKTFGALTEVDGSRLVGARIIRAEGARFIGRLDNGDEIQAQTYRGTKTDNPNATLVAVGDIVQVLPMEDSEGVVEYVTARRTKLSRRAAGKRDFEQVIVANVDTLVIVASTGEPRLRTGIIDRYIVAGLAGGLAIVVVLNKIDLADEEEKEEIAYFTEVYEAIGYSVFAVSSVSGSGIEDLRGELVGHTSVFAGHSGVGKSSIINALFGAQLGRTGALSKKYKKGAHTTSSSILHPMHGLPNTYVADTPGVREFSNFELDSQNLKFYFEEFVPLAEHCKITNCTHIHEPGCAVIDAGVKGDIAPERYDSYSKLFEEARTEEKRRLEKL